MLKFIRERQLLFPCVFLCLFALSCSSGSKSSTSTGPTLAFVSPVAGPTIEPGQSVNLTVNENVTWTLQSGTSSGKPVGQLSGETSTTATYVAPPLGTPPSCGSTSQPPTPEQVAITATSTSDTTQSAVMAIIIAQASPCIATAPLFSTCPAAGAVIFPPSNQSGVFQVGTFTQVKVYDGGGQVGTPFGVPPFTWSFGPGTLPNGVSLAPSSDGSEVIIQGTPVASGCSIGTLQITDATGVTASQAFALVVVPPSLNVQVPAYPIGYVNASTNLGIPYPPTAFSVSGGTPPYTWSSPPNEASDLPGGLCLSSNGSNVPTGCANSSPPSSSQVGVIWGTPQAGDLANEQTNGPYAVSLQITDSQQPYPAVGLLANLSMTVAQQPASCPTGLIIAPTALNGGKAGTGSVAANSYLQGSLAFLAQGFDANGPVAIAGSVTLDGNGGVTGGVEDVTRTSGSQNVTILPTGSSYSVGGSVTTSALGAPNAIYNQGCLTLANSVGTTTTFAFSLGGCSNGYTESGVVTTNDNACGMKQDSEGNNIAAGVFTTGRIMESDDNAGTGTRVSGILRLQNSSSFSNGSISGLYAFGLSGQDSSGGHFGMAGSMQASSGTLSSVAADIDDAGTVSAQLTSGTGTYNIGSNGRGTATLTVGPVNLDLALYTVSSSEIIAVTTDNLAPGQPIAGGESIQASNPISFSALQNSHMFRISGLSQTGPDVSVGVLHFDGVGDLTGTTLEDQAGTLGTTSISATYTVDATTGRTAFSTNATGQTLGSHSFVAYILPPSTTLTRANCSQPASCVTGFLVGNDSSAQTGVMEFQTSILPPPPPFSNTFVAGDYLYGNAESLDSSTPVIDGTLSSDTKNLSNRSQIVNYSNSSYCLQPGCAVLLPAETLASASFSVKSDGTGTFGGETVSVTNGNIIFYIDESPLNLHPSVLVVEQ